MTWNKKFVVKSTLTCCNLNFCDQDLACSLFWDVFSSYLDFSPPFKNKQAQHGSKAVFPFARLLPISHSSLPDFQLLVQVQFSLVLHHLPKVWERGHLDGKRKVVLKWNLVCSWKCAYFSLRKWLLEERRQAWPWSKEGILIPPNNHSAEDCKAWVWEIFPRSEKFCSEARSARGWLCKYLVTHFRY